MKAQRALAPVVIDQARLSERELNALSDRIIDEADQLLALGIDPSAWGPGDDCVRLE